MGAFSSKVSPEYEVVSDPYKAVRESLNNWLVQSIGKAGPTYSGDMVAEKTPQETQSLESLNRYANRTTPQTTQLARDELTKTLSGNYDPSSSPFYQAIKAESARNLQESQQNIASNAAGGGRYWSGGRLKAQGNAATEQANNLNIMLGQLSENERNRMMQAVPLAQSMGQEESLEPLQTTQALQQYGSLDRILQQAAMDALYNEWDVANRQYPLQVAQAAAPLAAQAPTLSQVGNKTSWLGYMLDPGASMLGYDSWWNAGKKK